MTSYNVEMRRVPDLDPDEVARRLRRAYSLILSWAGETVADADSEESDHALTASQSGSSVAGIMVKMRFIDLMRFR